MDMKKTVGKLGLLSSNSIVIGSGILQALGIRESNDIDLVVTEEVYFSLKKTGRLKVTLNHGKKILSDDTFEIGMSWFVFGKTYKFEDFKDESVVIDGVRYIKLDFLYRVKKSWLKDKVVRPKDIRDVELIEEYLKSNKMG